MKKNLFTLCLVSGMFCFSMTSLAQGDVTYGTNLILTGDFEGMASQIWAPTGPWNQNGTNYGLETANFINGLQSLRLTGANAWSGTNQTIEVKPEASYKVGFSGRTLDVAGPSGGASTNRKLNLTVKATDNNGATLKQLVIETGTNVIDLNDEITVPKDVTALWVNVWKDNGIAYVDDVYVIEILSSATNTKLVRQGKDSRFQLIPQSYGTYSLTAGQSVEKIQIFNLCGQLVFSKSILTEQTDLNLTDLSKGAYIVKASLSDGSVACRKYCIN